jgi:glycosyltransferase involved in cell wall biosynthesis
VFIINDSFRRSAALRDEHPIYTPPPVDRRQFRPDGPNLRAAYGLDAASPVIVAIGKLSPDRGFETVLQSFARFREHRHDARLMIIGHGEHRPSLEAVASGLGISPHVIWAGYHEDDLAEHYRAADLLFFTAPGSDAGHRAVLEAMACGVVPISAPLPGISSLLRGLDSLVASDASAEAVAARAEAIWSGGVGTVRDRLQQQAGQFAYSRAAERLKTAYATVM